MTIEIILSIVNMILVIVLIPLASMLFKLNIKVAKFEERFLTNKDYHVHQDATINRIYDEIKEIHKELALKS